MRNPITTSESYRSGGIVHALSDWQAASLRPWDPGVYERSGTARRYACWSGKAWMQSARTPESAASKTQPSAEPAAAWRGLAAPSGQHCATCRGHSVVDLGVDPDTQADLIAECPDC